MKTEESITQILRNWLHKKSDDDIVFTDDIAIGTVVGEIMSEVEARMPTEEDKQIALTMVTERINDEKHLKGFIAGWNYCDEFYRSCMKVSE